MKDYQKKQLERISTFTEQKEALEIIQPSLTVLLDYQIEKLKGAITNKTNISRHSDETILKWEKTLNLLLEARKLY